ncbi:MAG TPA: DNA mismatch repair protein MutS, partial [Clostridia bacterium]|nr:DNA mismatch repair protein MutS [Clostridia bacterium]
MSRLTPMMKQYMEIKEQNKDALLFFRLGDFYEMFFQDAEIASRELEITLTARNCGLDKKAPMCGVPYHAAEGYIARLIEKGYKVAVCEQTQDPSEAKGIVERDVVRVITPGTLLESSMLDETNNNFILSIFMGKDGYGFSWADISTGEFYVSEIVGDRIDSKIMDLVSSISPKEVVVHEDIEAEKTLNEIQTRYNALVTHYNNWVYEYYFAYEKLTGHFKVHSLEGYGCEHMDEGIRAAGALLEYLSETQKNSLRHITSIKPHQTQSSMVLDISTRRNLELTETLRENNKKGSLLWLLDKTNTAMGGRLIRQWIQQPLTQVSLITDRLEGVEEIYRNPILMEELRVNLRNIYDLERLMGRISYGNANARDLISFKQSLKQLPAIKTALSQFESNLLKSFYN